MAWARNHFVPFQKTQRFNLHFAADFQLGSEACDKRMVRSWVNEVASDPAGMWGFLGDLTDDDRPTTRDRKRAMNADRMEVLRDESSRWMKSEGPALVELLEPLAKMPLGCLGVLAGHHWRELWIALTDGENGVRTMNSAEWVCRELAKKTGKKIPYLGEMSAWVWLRFRKNGKAGENSVSSLIHLQHGVGGGQTLSGAINKLEGTQARIRGDAYVRAHDCKLVGGKIDEIGPLDSMAEEPQIVSRTIPILNIGSATRGYVLTRGEPNYVEKAMMRPTTMGFGVLHALVHKRSRTEDINTNWIVDFKLEL